MITEDTAEQAASGPEAVQEAKTGEASLEPEPEPEPEPELEPEATETDQPDGEPTPAERTETDNGLTPTYAQGACILRADTEAYPDSIKVHTIVGKKQEVIKPDEIRFLWEATLESSAGGELRGELLCIATGDNDNPEVQLEFR